MLNADAVDRKLYKEFDETGKRKVDYLYSWLPNSKSDNEIFYKGKGPQYWAGEAGGREYDDGGKGKGKGNTRRPGKQTDRDPEKNNPKFPPRFWEWYHKSQNIRDYKLPGQPDPNLEWVLQDWKDLGRPKFSPQSITTTSTSTNQYITTTAKVGTAVIVGYVLLKGVEAAATFFSGGALGWTLAF